MDTELLELVELLELSEPQLELLLDELPEEALLLVEAELLEDVSLTLELDCDEVETLDALLLELSSSIESSVNAPLKKAAFVDSFITVGWPATPPRVSISWISRYRLSRTLIVKLSAAPPKV